MYQCIRLSAFYFLLLHPARHFRRAAKLLPSADSRDKKKHNFLRITVIYVALYFSVLSQDFPGARFIRIPSLFPRS